MTNALFDDIADAFDQHSLRTLILFVTNRCNLKCHFCCYKDSLNSSRDLPFDVYEKMARSIPRLKSLLVSGGEPFLREDLFDIISLFCRHAGARFISVPSNGYFTSDVMKRTEVFLKRENNAFLTLLFSIDGFAETHNKVRGLNNSHANAMESVKQMLKIKENYPNVRVNITTVVCEDNMNELAQWVNHVKTTFPTLDYHNLEIVRVGMPHIDAVPNIKQISDVYKKVFNQTSRYYTLEKKDNHVYPFFSERLARLLTRGFDLSRLDIDTNLIKNNRDWPFKCLAGRTICVVDANGDFRACELRGVLGNLKDHDYNILHALDSEANKNETKDIARGKCFCSHGCFIGDTERHYPSTFMHRILWHLIRERLSQKEGSGQ